MKFLEIKTERGFVRFALDSVMTYGMVLIEKKGRKKEHCLVSVTLKPVKNLDGDERGVVIERCDKTDLEFEDFEAAQKAMNIIDA